MIDNIFYDLNRWFLDNFRLEENETPQLFIDFCTFITHMGDGEILIGIALCLLAAMTFKKAYKLSVLWVVTVTTAFLLSSGLKHLFDKARPDEMYHLVHAASPAFPSGHSLRSTVVYIVGTMLVTSVFRIRNGRNFLMIGSIVLPFLIGLSRLLLGVHWFGDVLAGWFIGTAICVTFYLITKRNLILPQFRHI